MNGYFKIRMCRSLVAQGLTTGDSRAITFFKGRTYLAQDAINQPDWKKTGKIFAFKTVRRGNLKSNQIELLLVGGDYVKL